MSQNTRTSLDKNSEILMPPTISDVPRKLEAIWKRQKFYADRQTQPSRVFAKGDNVLVEEQKEEWYSGTVKEFADSPRLLLVQDDTSKRVYRRNTKHVKKTNTQIERKAQKTMRRKWTRRRSHPARHLSERNTTDSNYGGTESGT
jgi:hypothetical protein